MSAALVLGLTAGIPTASATDGPGASNPTPSNQLRDTPQDRLILRNSAVLSRIADQLINAPEDRRKDVPGFAGIVLDAEQGKISVYWKGEAPARIGRILDAAPRGITGRILPAPYSKHELSVARDAFFAREDTRDPASLAARGLRAGSVTALSDGTGLDVAYDIEAAPLQPGLATDTAEPPAAESDIGRRMTADLKVPVILHRRPAPVPAATRQNDASPWKGGAALYTPTKKFCSPGFGAYSGAGSFLITANHCGAQGLSSDWAEEPIGDVWGARPSMDAAVIKIANGYSVEYYYDGPWDTQWGKIVDGSATNWTGDYICGSGAMSGIRCNVKIINDDTTCDINTGVRVSPCVQAKRVFPADIALALGDSGGPIVASSDGTYGPKMTARGIISASCGTWVVCPPEGDGVAGPTECFEGVSYVPIRTILNNFGISLRTG
ncbi:hypothetical protein ACIRL2_45295 [Embleya sp. NPDC127516]|uniref:hypothetical protein n=1 Tax=Embleya sp. NPDC127516 TaxID=3363990 RepID=UPI0038010898